jgi:hypothetical protein
MGESKIEDIHKTENFSGGDMEGGDMMGGYYSSGSKILNVSFDSIHLSEECPLTCS